MAYTPSTDFIFTAGSYTPSTDFNFSTSGSPSGHINAVVDGLSASFVADFTAASGQVATISGTLDGLTGLFVARNSYNTGEIAATLADVVGGFIADYDSNILNFTTLVTCALSQSASKIDGDKVGMLVEQATPDNVKIGSPQQQGTLLFPETCFDTDAGTPINIDLVSNQEQGTRVDGLVCFVQEQGTFIDIQTCFASEQGTAVTSFLCAIMEQMTKVYPDEWCAPIQDSGTARHDILRLVYLEPDPPFDYTPSTNFNFTPNPAYQPTKNFEFNFGKTGFTVQQHVIGINSSTTCSSFTSATPKKIKRCAIVEETSQPERGQSVWIDLPPVDPDPDPPSGTTYTVPIQEVYPMQHTKNVTLENLTDIKMDNLSLKFDADSFAWQFSGELLDHAQLALVKPLANGSPIKLIVTINGYVWHILADLISHSREFAKRSITITGRGVSSLLSAPNEQSTSGTQGSLLSVQQLADFHLPFGWTINWQTVTWNVTGGAYSWQGRTPLQAIADIAAAAGAMVLPARDSQALTIKPRYPVLPWNFAATAVDVAIPDAAILELTHRQTSRQTANGVYIHGSEIGGQLGFCRLNGTAGDVLIATQSNALMTDVIGLRAAGERLLAGDYTQPDISSIKTEMDGTIIPLIEVGTFVGITVDAVETKGIVNGVEINSSGVEVTQTLTIGEETNNQWVAFRSLLPKDPLLVGTITSTTGTTSIINLIDGGVVNVRGTGSVTDTVYIRSGQIQGDAPNLALNTIVI